jgi:hypothetical protein
MRIHIVDALLPRLTTILRLVQQDATDDLLNGLG